MSTVSRIINMIDQLDIPENEVKDILKDLLEAVEYRLLRPEPDMLIEEGPTNLFKTVYRVEVLSDEDTPYEQLSSVDLATLHYQITEGHASGVVTLIAAGELTPEQMSEELIAQGSDPDFFSTGADEEYFGEDDENAK